MIFPPSKQLFTMETFTQLPDERSGRGEEMQSGPSTMGEPGNGPHGLSATEIPQTSAVRPSVAH
jgi:hypothetical protein